jgi:hypothetical protein
MNYSEPLDDALEERARNYIRWANGSSFRLARRLVVLEDWVEAEDHRRYAGTVAERHRHWVFSAWRANLRTLQDQLARQKQRHHKLRQITAKRLWAKECRIRELEVEVARLKGGS